jgi:anti-sigma regulatory factor (Ser/Thr protein kinase)
LRSYALTTDDPAAILSLVDQKLHHFEPGEMATALLAVLNPSREVMRISAAGHPAPVLASAEGSVSMLEQPIDPPHGVRHARSRRTTDIELPRGAVVCMYTDGLIERRRVPLDDRLRLLMSVVNVDAPETVCANVMRVLVGSEPPVDDIALLVVRTSEQGPGVRLELRHPAVPESLALLRSELRAWLVAAGATETAQHDVLVAAGEATANAVEHAYGPAGGEIAVIVELDGVDVIVRVIDNGQWREARGHGRGRGTLMMETTTDEFHVERTPTGTEVVLRRRIDQ